MNHHTKKLFKINTITIGYTKNKVKKLTKPSRIRKTLTNLIESSTIHGLPKVIVKEKVFIKLLWFVFFIISIATGAFLLTMCVLNFFDYDVVTQTDIMYEIPTQFPTVTFYNLKEQKKNYTLEEILISCKFDDEPCNAMDFEIDTDEKVFKFNSGKNSLNQPIPFKTSALPGKESGLKLELFSGLPDEDLYLSEMNKYDGFHIVVHNNTVDPRFHDGLDVSPGFAFNLVASRAFTSKLPMPYNECILDPTSLESHDSKIYKYMLNSRNYTYRHVDCYDYCLGLEMMQTCNITELESYETLNQKYISNESILSCFKKVSEAFFDKNVYEVCHPHCPLECESISYSISLSFAKFPNQIYYRQLINNSLIKSKYPVEYNIKYSDIEQSVVAFNVYYDDLKYTTITEVAKTTITDLISNMGGLLGLFIGVSFLSFGELVEMALEVIFILFEKSIVTNRTN